MTLNELMEALSDPDAYDHPVDGVEIRETHISVVFLAGDFVYKIKKPVDMGFLDFTTLERREQFCQEEVRLNRRLAPDVYLGVVPVVAAGEGLRFAVSEVEGDGADAGGDGADVEDDGADVEDDGADADGAATPIEWAVRMRRLPPDATMASWVAEGALRPYHVAVLGRRVADFHRRADAGSDVSRWGRFEVVAGNARENLEQSVPHVTGASAASPGTLTPELHTRLSAALERELSRFEPRIEARAKAGVPRDTHGDLHLDHVYVFADRDPPDDVVIIDCIEFNERFRFADPVADVAFLDMDLRYHGRPDLAAVLADAYFAATEDDEGRALLRFYSAYRAAVRAKVEGMRAAEAGVSASQRERAVASARAHWLLALGLLEPPRARPALALVGGLPGTGKSTLASALGERAAFEVLSSDVTRKRLAGLEPEMSAAAAFGAGIYTPEWDDRVYAELETEAERRLLRGDRVLVDASFREEARRASLLELADRLRAPALFLHLEAPAARVRRRVAERRGGASDADLDIYEAAAARWEPASPRSAQATCLVDTGQSPGWSVEQSLTHLRAAGVFA